MPILYVLSGPEVGRQINVADGAILGRADDCDATLHHKSVSRRHARLERKRGDWRIVDLASRNGLHRGDKQAKHLYLEDGAEFRLGDLELRIRFDAAEESAASSAETPAPARAIETPPAPDASAPVAAAADDLEDDFEFEDDTPVAAPEVIAAAAPGDEIQLEDPDEISLEEPDEIALEPARPAPARSVAPPRPTAPARPAPARASAPKAAPGAGAAALDPARKALQYNRIETRGGFLTSDLAQYPLWVRLGALLLALVLFAGLFLIAFRAASAM